MSAEELKIAVMTARSALLCTGQKALPLQLFANEYLKQEEEPIPFAKFGYDNPATFLVEAAGFTYRNGSVSFESEETRHISDMLNQQKAKPKLASAKGASSLRFSVARDPPPPIPRFTPAPSTLGVNSSLSTASSGIQKSREELLRHCSIVYPEAFRHELRLKLQRCPRGCTPDEFVEHFNQTNFEKFGYRKDLDLKGLSLKEFFEGLPDVFDVEIVNGTPRLNPALTNSLPPKTIGYKRSVPPRLQNLANRPSTVATFTTTEASSVKSFPTINEMIPIFTKVNAFYADREVGMEEYLRKVGEVGGNDAARWLKMKAFTMDTFSTFLIDNSSGFSVQRVTGKNSVFIRRSTSQIERLPVQAVQTGNSGLYQSHAPYSTAYKTNRLTCSNEKVDVIVEDFDIVDGEALLSFCTADGMQARLALMRSLRQHTFENLPPSQLEPGTPCITLHETQEGSHHARSTLLSVRNGQAEVYCVDFFVIETVPVKDVYRIPSEFLRDCVHAHQAIMVNGSPDGKAKIALKDLQDIKLELEYQFVKANILRCREDKQIYEILIHGLVEPEPGTNSFFSTERITQMQNGYHSMAAGTNGDVPSMSRTNGNVSSSNRTVASTASQPSANLTCQVRVLPNCETITVVQRGSGFFVSSRVLSHLLGLEKDTFLSTLRESFITVQNAWELSSQDKALLKMVEEQECNLMPKPGETMIPMEAAAPLMKAYLFIQSTTLDNEKHILRYLKNFQ